MGIKVCSVDECQSAVLAKGMCQKHYERMRRTGTTDKAERARVLCAQCGQRDGTYIRGEDRICQACYRREQRPTTRIHGVCLQCGEAFEGQRRYSADSGRGMFCSRKCKALMRKRDGRAAESAIKHYYMSRYGLTVEQVEEMRSHGCGICGALGEVGRWGALHIDHDHATGHVRGILCSECNTGIGKFRDDPALLRAAIKYLEAPAS